MCAGLACVFLPSCASLLALIAWPNHLAVLFAINELCMYLCLVVCDHRESSSLHPGEPSTQTLVVLHYVDGCKHWNICLLLSICEKTHRRNKRKPVHGIKKMWTTSQVRVYIIGSFFVRTTVYLYVRLDVDLSHISYSRWLLRLFSNFSYYYKNGCSLSSMYNGWMLLWRCRLGAEIHIGPSQATRTGSRTGKEYKTSSKTSPPT